MKQPLAYIGGKATYNHKELLLYAQSDLLLWGRVRVAPGTMETDDLFKLLNIYYF